LEKLKYYYCRFICHAVMISVPSFLYVGGNATESWKGGVWGGEDQGLKDSRTEERLQGLDENPMAYP
jgi:hypothetical protein